MSSWVLSRTPLPSRRERFGYGGDAAATHEAVMLNWDVMGFMEKRVRDHNSAQDPAGGCEARGLRLSAARLGVG